jgi:hypothetical protein
MLRPLRAGIVNTIYSRPSTLLIEFSPDGLGKNMKGNDRSICESTSYDHFSFQIQILASFSHLAYLSFLIAGVPWRMNSLFAQSVGLSTYVIVVPHNESARDEQELQKVWFASRDDAIHFYLAMVLVVD